MNASVVQCQPRADYPSLGPTFPGLLAVAKGMRFAAEDNGRCVGFALDDIGPLHSPRLQRLRRCGRDDPRGHIAAFYLLLRDTLSGFVCLANKGYCGKLWVHDGYIYLT